MMRVKRSHDRARRAMVLGALGLALWATGCGDPLADGAYRGEPLLTVEGTLSIADPEVQASIEDGAPVQLALFWAISPTEMTDSSETVSGVEQRVEVSQSSVLRYSISLFSPPPSALMRRPLLGTGKTAMGQVIAYADTNGSGRWEPGVDELLGGVPGVLVTYTPDGATGPMFPSPLEPGYHIVGAADCAVDEGVRRLVTIPKGTKHRLELVRGNVQSLYVDLNCDGNGNEWLPSSCPPPEILASLCEAMAAEPDPAEDPVGPPPQDLCEFCLPLDIYDGCENQLPDCGETWPELCEPYQLCLDPAWRPDPYLLCDFEYTNCTNVPPPPDPSGGDVCENAVSECVATAHCTHERYACEASGAPACDQAFENCVASALPF